MIALRLERPGPLTRAMVEEKGREVSDFRVTFQPLKGCGLSTVISVGADQSSYSLVSAMMCL
jgi:hypothetical protein